MGPRFAGASFWISSTRRNQLSERNTSRMDCAPSTPDDDTASRRDEAPGFGDEKLVGHTHPMEKPQDERPQREDRILAGTPEPDAARFVEVPYRDRNVADTKPEMDALQQELRVEDEIVAVRFERDGLQYLASIGTEATMPFTEVLPGENVFDDRQGTIHEVFQ